MVKKRIADIRPGHCCCLVYTSGTTGNPKAVMCSHDNCVAAQAQTAMFSQRDSAFLDALEVSLERKGTLDAVTKAAIAAAKEKTRTWCETESERSHRQGQRLDATCARFPFVCTCAHGK